MSTEQNKKQLVLDYKNYQDENPGYGDFEGFFEFFEENHQENGWNRLIKDAEDIVEIACDIDPENLPTLVMDLLAAVACQSAESALRIVAKKIGKDADSLITILKENI